MGSFEENYSNDVLASFTAGQRKQLQALHQQLDAKYEGIALLIANDVRCRTSRNRSGIVIIDDAGSYSRLQFF